MILLLGGTGYVGKSIASALTAKGMAFRTVSRSQVNYSHRDELINLICEVKPQFLINAAGYTGQPNVDKCEDEKTECLLGNAVLPGIIREACEATETPWGHVSSGCIFTGTRAGGHGFTELDPPNFSFRQNNCSFYSGCKALGEEVLQGAKNCYIWRLRIPFNNQNSPRNYISKMMRYDRLLEATNSLSELNEFADCCIASWTQRIPYGVYNLTNPGFVTTRQVVEMIRKYGLSDRNFQFFDSESQFMTMAARAPRSNCVLDSTKAVGAGLPISPIEVALDRALKNWQA